VISRETITHVDKRRIVVEPETTVLFAFYSEYSGPLE
jgi:hypothetical protein